MCYYFQTAVYNVQPIVLQADNMLSVGNTNNVDYCIVCGKKNMHNSGCTLVEESAPSSEQ